VLNDTVGIEKGFMTTIHSYTGDQPTLDTMHKDLYRARAAAMSMIPTSTGAAKAVGLVLPELNGKLDGVAIRVPTPNVSVVDLTFEPRATPRSRRSTPRSAAADGPLKGVLGYTDEPLVSMDFNHDPHSSVFHMDQTKVMDGTFVPHPDLVRQRVGLLQPHARHRGGDGQAPSEFRVKLGLDRRRHEFRHVPAQPGDFLHQLGRNRLVPGLGHQEDRLDRAVERAVHAHHLEFILEIRHRAQAADDQRGAHVMGAVDQQVLERMRDDLGAGLASLSPPPRPRSSPRVPPA
jgi:hypothetical protein